MTRAARQRLKTLSLELYSLFAKEAASAGRSRL